MSFERNGQTLEGFYLGKIHCKGTILDSRVKYGGDVQHYVELAEPINAFGTDREVILVDESEIESGQYECS